MKASYKSIDFEFNFPAVTSRGSLSKKTSVFFMLEQDDVIGIGECSTIPGLSIDSKHGYFEKLDEIVKAAESKKNLKDIDLTNFPSIAFGLETAMLDLESKGSKILFKSDFVDGSKGIPINGLVWMGDKAFMQKQLQEKIRQGYRCIKLKVGALNFDVELDILSNLRKNYSENEIEIRLDANGAFLPNQAQEKLEKLAKYNIHSIEQPIRQGQYSEMAELCVNSPIPIVLDEELIGIRSADKEDLLKTINPAYIILKPSLIGGFGASEEWIQLAEKLRIQWWVTSALESNIGLNAIAQWTATLNNQLPQGLGTGQLYTNNIPSPLNIRHSKLFYHTQDMWHLERIL